MFRFRDLATGTYTLEVLYRDAHETRTIEVIAGRRVRVDPGIVFVERYHGRG